VDVKVLESKDLVADVLKTEGRRNEKEVANKRKSEWWGK
jgi:hypothetical protein